MRKKILALCLVCFLYTSTTYTNQQPASPTPAKNLKISQLLTAVPANVLFAYLSMLGGLISHECGHAFTNWALTGDKDFEIHIGATSNKKQSNQGEIFESKYFKIHSLNPFKGGHACYKNPQSKIKRFFGLIAGGVFKTIHHYCILGAIATYHKYQECNDLKKSCLYGVKHAITPFKNIHLNKKLTPGQLYAHVAFLIFFICELIHEMMYAWLPGPFNKVFLNPFKEKNVLSYRGDGTRAWDICGASDKTLLNVAIASYFIQWTLRGIVVWRALKCIKEYSTKNFTQQKDFDVLQKNIAA